MPLSAFHFGILRADFVKCSIEHLNTPSLFRPPCHFLFSDISKQIGKVYAESYSNMLPVSGIYLTYILVLRTVSGMAQVEP